MNFDIYLDLFIMTHEIEVVCICTMILTLNLEIQSGILFTNADYVSVQLKTNCHMFQS